MFQGRSRSLTAGFSTAFGAEFPEKTVGKS
jgi:hypothetical protein